MSDQNYLIALGSNLPSNIGDSAATIRAGLDFLAQMDVDVTEVSRFFYTPCFPPGAGPDYVNAAAKIRCAQDAQAVLDVLHQIEAELGRQRVQRWAQRTLDMDLIAAGDQVLPDRATYRRWYDLDVQMQAQIAPDQLVLPHPRMHQRAFVLIPLADIAPDWCHPVLEKTVSELLSELPEALKSDVVPV